MDNSKKKTVIIECLQSFTREIIVFTIHQETKSCLNYFNSYKYSTNKNSDIRINLKNFLYHK